LAKLDPTAFRDQEEWFGLMCSVHWLSGGQGIGQFIEWGKSDPSYADHDEIITMRWDSLSRGSDSNQLVAKGGLFFKALKNVGENPAAAQWQLQPEQEFHDNDEEKPNIDRERIDLASQATLD